MKKRRIYPRTTKVGQRKIDNNYKEWRRKVLERDGYECQMCGSKKKLKCHHLRRYTDSAGLRHSVKNGLTLCQQCHVKITGKESMYLAMFIRKVAENTEKFEKGKDNETS